MWINIFNHAKQVLRCNSFLHAIFISLLAQLDKLLATVTATLITVTPSASGEKKPNRAPLQAFFATVQFRKLDIGFWGFFLSHQRWYRNHRCTQALILLCPYVLHACGHVASLSEDLTSDFSGLYLASFSNSGRFPPPGAKGQGRVLYHQRCSPRRFVSIGHRSATAREEQEPSISVIP